MYCFSSHKYGIFRIETKGTERDYMKQDCCLYTASKGKAVGGKISLPPKQLPLNLSVDDILDVQELFFANGLHHIMVPDLVEGRTLVHNFLKSMHYFHDVACLAQDCESVSDINEHNILDGITDYCGPDITLNSIEEYFLDAYTADFMWVELNDVLMNNPLVLQTLYVMHSLDIAHRIPVLAISYMSHVA